MPSKIEKLAQSLLKDPVKIKLAVSKPAEKIQQSAYVCYEPQKLGIIRDLFKSNSLKRVIIFSGKKDKVKDISRQLRRMHINAGEMHSDLSQAERDETMYRFKSEQIDVLVATDIVARGIDIDDIAMVINYDVPHDVEDYVHRIGRTARADKDGIAITFVNDNDIYYFMQIEQFLEKTITKNPLPQELGDGPQYVSHGKPRNGSNGRGHGNGASGGKGRGRGHGNGGHGQKSRGNNSSSSTNKSADHRGQQHRRKPTESNSK
jgi:superfamily II DNA/RNA helicase